MLLKIRLISKKASNESCSKLNFVQKRPRAHMPISPRSGARALERLLWLLYGTETANYIHLWLNSAKNTHYFKKLQMKVVQKKSPGACIFISTRSGAMTLERLIWLKYNIVLKLQITFGLGHLSKNTLLPKKLQMKVVQN